MPDGQGKRGEHDAARLAAMLESGACPVLRMLNLNGNGGIMAEQCSLVLSV